MKRRDFLVYTASSAGTLLPTVPYFAASAELSPSGDALGAAAHSDIIEDNFRGVEITMPDGSKKLYPDPSKWAFTFWPGTKWPDSYGDGTNWLAGNAECQTYVTPFISKVKGSPVPVNLRYDPFSIRLGWPAYQGVAVERGAAVGLSDRWISAFRFWHVVVANLFYLRQCTHGGKIARRPVARGRTCGCCLNRISGRRRSMSLNPCHGASISNNFTMA